VALAACSIAAAGAPQLLAPPAATAAGPDDDFQLLPSGLKVLDVRPGEMLETCFVFCFVFCFALH
jgi:hypothetical protein